MNIRETGHKAWVFLQDEKVLTPVEGKFPSVYPRITSSGQHKD